MIFHYTPVIPIKLSKSIIVSDLTTDNGSMIRANLAAVPISTVMYTNCIRIVYLSVVYLQVQAKVTLKVTN